MTVYAAQGDARETMALLWRESSPSDEKPAPGPKPGLSVDTIVKAAIGIADNEGMKALSMRAVGDRLDRTAMALYTYVPNKSVLLDLMFDEVHAALPGTYQLDDGWRPALAHWSVDLCDFCIGHPWLLQISQVRPVLGPNEYRMLETVTRVLNETGLGPRQTQDVVGTLTHFIRGAAQTIAESRAAPGVTGLTDEEWWIERSTQQMEVTPDFAERYPLISKLAEEGAFDPVEGDLPYFEAEARGTFEAGLELVLDGIEAAVTTTSRGRL